MAWDKGWSCKDKNRTEDVLFTSFWDALCLRNTSAACLPPSKTADKKSSSLRVGNARYATSYRRNVYLQWLRRRLPMALDMPTKCSESGRGLRVVEIEAHKKRAQGPKEE